MRKPRTRGIYIHIPFCRSKCPYCDFYSILRTAEADIAEFVRALEAEIRYYGRLYGRAAESDAMAAAPAGAAAAPPHTAALPIDSIYFGGGTPSLLSEAQFGGVLRVLSESFEICPDAEISMEANPATVTEEKLAAYKASGLNRLSIGAQSFDPAVLKLLGRLHKAKDTAEAVEAARKAGIQNISLDLMFGISGQTAESWEQTVRQAAALRPQHISLYTLEIADGTRFARDLDRGIYRQTDEESDRRMYEAALKLLADAGLYQYEISNVSLPGYECRHNLRYWSMGEYLGFGPSAHSFVDGMRFNNIANTAEYVKALRKGYETESMTKREPHLTAAKELILPSYTENIHINSEYDNISEYMFTALRRIGGVDKRDFRDNFGRELWEVFADEMTEFESFVRGGFAEDDERGIRLTASGMNISNRIMLLFV